MSWSPITLSEWLDVDDDDLLGLPNFGVRSYELTLALRRHIEEE